MEISVVRRNQDCVEDPKLLEPVNLYLDIENAQVESSRNQVSGLYYPNEAGNKNGLRKIKAIQDQEGPTWVLQSWLTPCLSDYVLKALSSVVIPNGQVIKPPSPVHQRSPAQDRRDQSDP
jgi:hypothetical protein